MRITARLNSSEGRVLCPRIGEWRDLDECRRCVDIRIIERGGDDEVVAVRCTPEVDDLSDAIDRLARA